MDETQHVLEMTRIYTDAMKDNIGKLDEMFQLLIDNYSGQNILPVVVKWKEMTTVMLKLTENQSKALDKL